MLLRSTIEKKLPLKENEKRLSEDARQRVFRGFYLFSGKIIGVSNQINYDPSTEHKFPHKTIVTRESKSGVRSTNGRHTPVWKNPALSLDAEMVQPQAVSRANRIESIARKIKVASALVGASTVIALAVVTDGFNNKGKADEGAAPIGSCEDVAPNNGALISIPDEKLSAVRKVGEDICSIANDNYLILQHPAE